MQSMLLAENLPTGPIDGRFGKRTKKALQAFLKARGYETGCCCCFGRRSTRALQAWIKDQGGEPGPLDGCWGRRTTSALQAVLNKVRAEKAPAKDEKAPAKEAAPTVANGMPVPSAVPMPEVAVVSVAA